MKQHELKKEIQRQTKEWIISCFIFGWSFSHFLIASVIGRKSGCYSETLL